MVKSKPEEKTNIEVPASADIIDNMSSVQVKNELEKINVFSNVINKTLISGTDYAPIPNQRGGSDKPSLLKSGAEKIFTLLRLVSKYDIISKVEDYEKGFFAYKIRCTLYNDAGQVRTEGLGAANTRETRYRKQDAFTLQNTVLKMAKKRAQVDAALTVSSLSSMFTQDIDEIAADQKARATNAAKTMLPRATAQQVNNILGLAQQLAILKNVNSNDVLGSYKVTEPKALNKQQADRFIKKLETDLNALTENLSSEQEPKKVQEASVKFETPLGDQIVNQNKTQSRGQHRTLAPNPDQISLDIPEDAPF